MGLRNPAKIRAIRHASIRAFFAGHLKDQKGEDDHLVNVA